MTRQQKAASTRDRRGLDRHSRHGHSTPARRRSESAATQCARLLAYLQRRGHVSTFEARGGALRIPHPAGRVFDLRSAGVGILTEWDERQGCGRYFLRGSHDAIEG
ncbi:helix-turn-helix domain-containing protein [uncultured Thiocystis sp.]|uniref:helix-turn-helix domain-containing protein n=1 Tax=uncultured Thiocystis sp. TaxID=1202134 RepID=UPI00342B45CE